MSDSLTNTLDQTQPAGISDRTQELIDEVNRLLEMSQVATQQVATQPAAAQQVAAPAPEATATPAETVTAANTAEPVQPLSSLPTPAPAPAAEPTAPAPANAEMSSFVSGLVVDVAAPAETSVATTTGEVATIAESVAPQQAPPAATPVEEIEVAANVVTSDAGSTAAPTADADNPFASVDLAALLGTSSALAATPQKAAPAAPAPIEVVTEPSPALAEDVAPASSQQLPAYDVRDSLRDLPAPEASVEAAIVEAAAEPQSQETTEEVLAVSNVDSIEEEFDVELLTSDDLVLEGDALAFEESSSAVDELREFVEGDDEVDDPINGFGDFKPESEVATEMFAPEPEAVTAEDASETQENESASSEPQSFTEKYLADLKNSLDEGDDIPFSSTSSQFSAAAPEASVEPAQGVEQATSEQAAVESAEVSVESWMAKNFGKSEESSEDEGANDNSAAGGDDAPSSDSSQPLQQPSEPLQQPSEPAIVTESGNPPFAAQEVEANASVADAIFENQPQLEALIGQRLQGLEIRVGQMFQSLSKQIESYSGIAAEPVAMPMLQQSAATAAEVDPAADGAAPAADLHPADSNSALQERLRKTEIELSISRAKVSQERNRLEQLQADLERREAAIEERLKNGSGGDSSQGKAGIMDRWKRHLG